MPRITRREFLKLAGAAGLVGLAGFHSIYGRSEKRNQASALGGGSWADGPKALSHPVHLALLPSGKVLYIAGSGFHRPSAGGPFRAGTWDPATDNQQSYTVDKDIWCSGHALLSSGNVLVVGGTLKYTHQTPNHRWWGMEAVYEFDFQSESFHERSPMAHGRWYPTAVLLDDGKVQVVEGYDEFGYSNLLNEIYDPDTKSWSIKYDTESSRKYCAGCDSNGCANLPGAGSSCYGGSGKGVNPVLQPYPRMHLLPSGLVAVVGQNPSRYLWDPATGKWHLAGSGVKRSFGTSVLLPLQNTPEERGRILICGGSNTPKYPAIAKKSAEILEQNGMKIDSRFAQSMSYARRYCNPVILPTGKVVIIGGTRENNDKALAVYNPEMFDPVTERWSVLPPHSIPRIYHSGALLLTDGRVWVAGTSYSVWKYELRTEILSPSYVFEERPTIADVSRVAGYGGEIEIATPDAPDITAVSLVAFSSTTHHYNTDQRLIWLQILDRTSGNITASAPISSRLAPPGYYMVHVLNNGIPSKAAIVHLS
ncbi:MAG TPA: galactose oxidase-like domain-containing protein [Nitrososphaera sp.]